MTKKKIHCTFLEQKALHRSICLEAIMKMKALQHTQMIHHLKRAFDSQNEVGEAYILFIQLFQSANIY